MFVSHFNGQTFITRERHSTTLTTISRFLLWTQVFTYVWEHACAYITDPCRVQKEVRELDLHCLPHYRCTVHWVRNLLYSPRMWFWIQLYTNASYRCRSMIIPTQIYAQLTIQTKSVVVFLHACFRGVKNGCANFQVRTSVWGIVWFFSPLGDACQVSITCHCLLFTYDLKRPF